MSFRGQKSRPRAQKDPPRPRSKRGRKVFVRPKPGGNAGRAVATTPELSSISGLIDALKAEKIRFIVVGMTAAVLQGAPVTTFDVDLWIDLPSRQYMRVMNLALGLGAQMIANTVAVLPGDLAINFIYEVTGLRSFKAESRSTRTLQWMGRRVSVLPLERIYRSKSIVRRPKDLAHLPVLEQTMKLQKRLRRRKKD